MKRYDIPTVKQKPDNIILHTGTNDLKTKDTPEEITMGILNLAMTCKTDTMLFTFKAFSLSLFFHDLTSLMRKL